MATDLGCTIGDLMHDEAMRQKIDITKYISDDIGLPTLNDILSELAKPGRDPRTQREEFHFAEGIEKVEDLVAGMKLPGIVTNLTAFGAFVDVGVHQDGLIHTSQLADRFVKDPSEVLKVNQVIEVTVLAVDLERRRISLTLKKNPEAAAHPKPSERKPGDAASAGKLFKDNTHEKLDVHKNVADSQESGRHKAENIGRRDEGNHRPHVGPDKKGGGKPLRDKRDEKIPFNNPFAAVFGKK
jgi:transcriptional accessory protein Tex/SPT6